ncbi:MAG TPA: DEAD/DEAH box helicase family protein [Pyrinomonadaceae bacterium]|nr:DEAD/DEAH box helicase family protein [Pyrinomonadaceae bacterium]HMP65991.1 DEAD/DEAH box helicase family protein [Pyrinomonadaceae bacterium]
MSDNPILNNPYDEPRLHYGQTSDNSLNYEDVRKGRRVFDPNSERQPNPTKKGRQKKLAFPIEPEIDAEKHIINLIRKEVGAWRSNGYPETTRVTSELLHYWFNDRDRETWQRLFFAQREAVETAIWLNEVAERSNAGHNILRILRDSQLTVGDRAEDQLPRVAFKMATGTGKTVVMATLVLYHFANRREYKNDVRFADYFLIIAPGVTIKDRLGVLFVDTRNLREFELEDYYHQRHLVPPSLQDSIQNLNARLVITNYHSFLPKTLQGNKKSPFDGKTDVHGNKLIGENKEDFGLVVKRILDKFKPGSRLLVLNDEAHHCYLPKTDKKTTDNEEINENERAAVWFTGLREVAKRYKVHSVYDLSATPYYLNGSGYEPYSLFPWVVTDFGLIEAIEAGLVKIPFLSESDNTQDLDQPFLANLYTRIVELDKNAFPRKGQRRTRAQANQEGVILSEAPPKLPPQLLSAFDMFYRNYIDYAKGERQRLEARRDLFTPPPVFIVVCNNTTVSKEVYKYLAGYEFHNGDGEIQTVPGAKEQFSNYDQNGRPKKRPPTLLIDSDALENSDQINDDFKKIFVEEIKEFRKDYTRVHGQGSAENISDAQILREVVNTVGQQGKLGQDIRCVVSVSMLTEGWDANTVTHIVGVRAFGSQLLCEQVAGRALRRVSYILQGYDKDGEPTEDKRKIVSQKFPPEYAHIIGIPFKLFKGGKAAPAPNPVETTQIKALKEKEELEITFPNVDGYRIDTAGNKLEANFDDLEPFEIDGTKIPVETIMGNAISPTEIKMGIEQVLERREGELIYWITKEVIRHKYSDDDGNPQFRYFGDLKGIVTRWYNERVKVIGIAGRDYRKLLFFLDGKTIASHIVRAINTHENNSEFIRPVLNHYNPFGSTRHVRGVTTKPVWETAKSHVNYVVEDSGWEGIAAKALDEMEIISYVKNSFLEFRIPYIKDGEEAGYYPDFIIRANGKDGKPINLILEVTGSNKKHKAEKKWYTENRWIPAVNAVREKHGMDEWRYIEIRDDIRDFKNEILQEITTI